MKGLHTLCMTTSNRDLTLPMTMSWRVSGCNAICDQSAQCLYGLVCSPLFEITVNGPSKKFVEDTGVWGHTRVWCMPRLNSLKVECNLQLQSEYLCYPHHHRLKHSFEGWCHLGHRQPMSGTQLIATLRASCLQLSFSSVSLSHPSFCHLRQIQTLAVSASAEFPVMLLH